VRVIPYPVGRETELAAAWTGHIQQEFTRIVPNAQDVRVQPWGGEAEGSISAGQNYLDTFVTFAVHGTPTAVEVNVQAPGQNKTGPHGDCQASCSATPQPDGSVLTVAIHDEATLRLITVTQYRPDGSVVFATAYNYDPTARTTPTYGPAVLMNVQQLTSFATDPALAFTP
jgi:hypothetical protein